MSCRALKMTGGFLNLFNMAQFIAEPKNNPRLNKFWLTIRFWKFQFQAHYNQTLKEINVSIGRRYFEGKFIEIRIH